MPTQIWIFQPELLTNSAKKLLEKLENKSIKKNLYKFANLEPVSSKILFVMLQGRHHPLQRRSAEQLAECNQQCAQVPTDAGFSSALREGIVAGIIFHQIEPVFRIRYSGIGFVTVGEILYKSTLAEYQILFWSFLPRKSQLIIIKAF